jgi:3-methyl-2-oxobutanoate hydroxymethyltransferase
MNPVKPVTVLTLREMKRKGERIAMLTAYDYSFAALVDRAGVDAVIVGDTLGMIIQGHQSTLPVTMTDMIYHSACVARGLQRTLLIGDLPFGAYQQNREQAFANAARLMSEGGAHVVKLEGGEPMADTVRFLVDRGVPVCGHVGLTPQSVHKFGGHRVQGRKADAAERIRRDAQALAEAGASLIVLEAVPTELAARITAEVPVPTIGIGAGADCDGQVLVLYDVLGIYPGRVPKFAKNFMAGTASAEEAVKTYVTDVKTRRFPGPTHVYHSE